MRVFYWFKNARRLSIFLTIVALMLYSYSLINAKLEIGYLGAIQGLPLSLFVSLSLLTIASAILWISPQTHSKLLSLQLIVLLIALYVTPLVLWGAGSSQANASGIYGRIGWADYINTYAHINSSIIWTQAWPAESLLNSAIMQVCGINDANVIITLHIFIWLFLSTGLIFCFLYNILGKEKVNYAFAGTWLFCLASPFLSYLQASQIGFLLLLAVLVLVSSSQTKSGTKFSTALIISLCIIFAALPVAHLLTSLVGLGLILGLLITTRKVGVWARFWLLLFVVIASWSIYITGNFLAVNLRSFVHGAFRFDIAFSEGVTQRVVVGDSSHQAIVILRLVTVGVFLAIAVCGAIVGWVQKEDINGDKFVFAVFLCMCAVPVMVSASYQTELVQRLYIYALPAIVYFGFKLLTHKVTAVVLILLLILALPLHYVYDLGNAKADFLTPSDVTAANFFNVSTNGGVVAGSQVTNPIGSVTNEENYKLITFDQLEWYNNTLLEDPGYCYIYLRSNDASIYNFLYNNSMAIISTQAHLDTSNSFDLFYTNGTLSIFYYKTKIY